MMSHSMFTLFSATLVSAVTAAMDNRTLRQRGWVAARTFVYCVGAVAGGSWLMHAIHG
jgi:hypothetical protein